MTVLAIILLCAQVTVLATIVIRDVFDPSKSALTMKSLFIAGYILFQPASALFTLFTGEVDVVGPDNIGPAALQFAMMSWAFMTLFLLIYAKSGSAERMAGRPAPMRRMSPVGLMLCAYSALIGGIILRDVIGTVPVLGVLTIMLSAGFFAAAAGSAAWSWAMRPTNVLLAVAGSIAIVGTAAALLQNSFSRRGLIAAIFSAIWAAYFARWRHGNRAGLVIRALAVAILGLTLVLFQSATRGVKGRGGDVFEYIEAFVNVDPKALTDAALGMASGQFAGVNSMWLIEAYPRVHAYWPLHSVWYFVTQPIPRVIWEGKPWSLGNEMVHQVGVTGVKRDEFSLGCGIVGHIEVDFPYVALPLYAFLIAWALRYLDARCLNYPGNPSIIIPISAATSQVLGMPRGELGLFAFNGVAWATGAWLAVTIANRALGRAEFEDSDAVDVAG
jgi:hypothetical protein